MRSKCKTKKHKSFNTIHVCFHSDKISSLISCIPPSDTLTSPGRFWRNSDEASEAPSTRRPPLLWAARLLGLKGLKVNETRPNLASTASWAARNQSETPSLFRALWTLQSAGGTAAFLPTPRN